MKTPLLRSVTRALTRREFMKSTLRGTAALAAATAPGALLIPRARAEGSSVAVLGAGLGGLTAAYRLKRAGVAFELFEAQNRLGGRVLTQDSFNGEGMFCELGAELIDSSHEELLELAKELDLPTDDFRPFDRGLPGHLFFFEGKHRFDDDLREACRPLAASLLRDMHAVFGGDEQGGVTYRKHTAAAKRFDRISLAQYLRSQAGVDRWALDAIEMAFLTEFGADPEEQSCINSMTLLSPDPEKFGIYGESDEAIRIRGGNSRLTEVLGKRLEGELRPGHRLVRVKRRPSGSVELTFDVGGVAQTRLATHVICAIPFSVLRHVEGIEELGLSAPKLLAIREMGYGTNMKRMVGYTSRPWREGQAGIPPHNAYTFTQLPSQTLWDTSRAQDGRSGIITAFLGGSAALDPARGSTESVLADMEAVTPGSRALHDGRSATMRWGRHPFALGSYACPKPGQYTTLVGAAKEPEWGGRLLFAGEHVSERHQGYMNGAVETGNRAAKRMIRKLSGAALGLALGLGSAAQAATHPLDPLDKKEITAVLEVLKKAGKLGAQAFFPYLMLKEPPKKEVLAFEPGAPFRREALVVHYDRGASKTTELTVDLKTQAITQSREIQGQPSVMLSEFDAAPGIVKADPRFAEAMKRRGIQNLDDVAVDVWAYGSPDTERSKKARLLRAITYFKGKHKNFYARPIEGFTAIVNMDERKVERVIDTDVLPVPPEVSDLDPKSIGKQRAALKPLVVSQPLGASFKVTGNEVEWEGWKFRYTMHPREGLVLQQVRYLEGSATKARSAGDHGRWRSILYRASLSEMMVPYGQSNEHWTYRAAFDEGEYGIGRYSGALKRGLDVPANATLFDALFVNDFGKPYVTKDAVALYERDGGLLWKHFDMYTGSQFARRGRDLVLGFITTISNYDYGLNWIFRQDGSLELEAQLSGIMLARGTPVANLGQDMHASPQAGKDLEMGHLVAPHVVAPHHQHFFNFRIDLDVDGAEGNTPSEIDAKAIPAGSENPAGNAFKMVETVIASEKQGARDSDHVAQRKWKVASTTSKNALGYPTGYLLFPGENASPYLQKGSPLLTRGGFVKHPVWFTQYADDELYAAGTYPTQRAGSDGLPEWIQKGRGLAGQDVVLWYTFCVTHAPRPEEWPVMGTYRTGFKLLPVGFFDRNPGLDVP